MPCTPGENYESPYSGLEVDEAVLRSTTNAASIATLNSNVSTNTNDITGLNTAVSTNTHNTAVNSNSISTLNTKTSMHNTQIATLQTDVSSLTTDVNTLNVTVAAIPATYAPIAGDSSQPFKVGSAVALDDALTIDNGNTRYAKILGDVNTTFSVSDPTSPSHAINRDWATLTYASIGTSYTKAESDAKYLVAVPYSTDTVAGIVRKSTASEATAGVEDTTYMTPVQIKAMIDTAIAAIP